MLGGPPSARLSGSLAGRCPPATKAAAATREDVAAVVVVVRRAPVVEGGAPPRVLATDVGADEVVEVVAFVESEAREVGDVLEGEEDLGLQERAGERPVRHGLRERVDLVLLQNPPSAVARAVQVAVVGVSRRQRRRRTGRIVVSRSRTTTRSVDGDGREERSVVRGRRGVFLEEAAAGGLDGLAEFETHGLDEAEVVVDEGDFLEKGRRELAEDRRGREDVLRAGRERVDRRERREPVRERRFQKGERRRDAEFERCRRGDDAALGSRVGQHLCQDVHVRVRRRDQVPQRPRGRHQCDGLAPVFLGRVRRAQLQSLGREREGFF
mmetsp:Transcript_9914/g.30038  ORF Transcript_9914/g.30038 Transcript_9914/m.30038 type:complete len:325 (+) Transcript_9914:170-1144(+)